MKRSGGALFLTAKWGNPMQSLLRTIRFLRAEGTSRRAVYNTLAWLHDLPAPHQETELLATLLGWQFSRQSGAGQQEEAVSLAQELAQLSAQQTDKGLLWLANFLSVAEFLARETRAGVTA